MRFILKFIVFLFLFPGWHAAISQSVVKITGTVYSTDGKPLHGANVVVIGSGHGAATDANGTFSIENLFAGEYTLRASFVGYQSQLRENVVVQKDLISSVHFRLSPIVISFDEIMVTAEQALAAGSDFREHIEQEQIQKSPARTLGELLAGLPGVDIIDQGGGAGQKRISIRGSNASQVLVLLDGVPLNDPLTGETDLDQIPLTAVEEIRVLKGGNSSIYGNGAIGGVVEIISKNEPLDEIRLNGHLGRFGARGIQPSVSGHAGAVQYFVHYQKLTEAGDYPYTYQQADGTTAFETRLNADFSSQNYFGKVGLDLDRHSVELQTRLYQSQRGLPGLVFSWTPFARAKSERRLYLARYAYDTQSWHIRLDLSRYSNETEFQNSPDAAAPLRYRTVPPYHSRYRILTHRGVLKSGLRFGRQQSMVFQTSVKIDDFEDRDLINAISGPVRQTDNFSCSLMLRNEWHLPTPAILSDFMINHALRYDYFFLKHPENRRKDQQISPRIGLLLSHHNGWLVNVRANLGRSFRVPTFADLFYQDFRVRGNAALLPEKSLDMDAGVQIGIPLLGRLEVGGNYFRHRIENLIVWQLGSFATWQPHNTDALLTGREWSGSWRLWHDRIEINLSHVSLNARDKSGERNRQDKMLVYRPDYTSKLGVNLNFKRGSLHYHRHWVGKRFVTPANTVSQPAYCVDNVTARLHQVFKPVELNVTVSVFNLFDKTYEIVEHAPMPGRHWRAGIEIVY